MKNTRTTIIIMVISLFIFSCKNKQQHLNSNNSVVKNIEVEHIPNTIFKSKVVDKKVQLVDVRTPKEYQSGHLENATLINYSDANFVKNAVQKLDKNQPVYVYCHSGGRSARAANLLKTAGFTVVDMKGGISDWKASGYKTVITTQKEEVYKEQEKTNNLKNVQTQTKPVFNSQKPVSSNNTSVTQTETIIHTKPIAATQQTQINTTQNTKPNNTVVAPNSTILNPPNPPTTKPLLEAKIVKVNTSDFKNRIAGKTVQLIDVRTPAEYSDGHIKGAKNINVYDSNFLDQTQKLDKSKPVYVYCRSGARSMKSAKKLRKAGFQVYNLNGGIMEWQNTGNKVVK